MCYFAARMKTKPTQYSLTSIISALCMIAALLWLTVSLPFVYSHQQKLAGQLMSVNSELPVSNPEEEANPFGNTSEEKAPNSSNSFTEEYMHHHDDLFLLVLLNSTNKKCKSETDYTAFHGELLSPPPEFSPAII